jgi:hypothetical protein
MAWTEITRPKYQRGYASDTADAEWEMIEPHLPPPAKCGRTREAAGREVIATLGTAWAGKTRSDVPPILPEQVQRFLNGSIREREQH